LLVYTIKIQEKIGDKMRTVRESKNYTQAELAKRIGISTNGYAKIEHGETPDVPVLL
jgi:transcriptional regulator with XRE-family HTH domain